MTLVTDVSVIFADARQVRAEALERLAGDLTSQRRVSHQTTPVKTGVYHALSRGVWIPACAGMAWRSNQRRHCQLL